MSNQHSPSDILCHLMLELGLVDTFDAAEWPGVFGMVPATPDNMVSFLDSTPVKDGRLMAGETIEHPGVMIMVRGTTFRIGHAKAAALAEALDAVYRSEVVIEGITYRVQNASRSAVISTGQETGNRRHLFTINVLLTVGELA